MITELALHDLVELEKYAQFPLPNLNSPLYIIKGSEFLNENLVGLFWVKLTTETSIILDEGKSRITKARAIREIFDYIRKELVTLGHDDSHLFIPNNPKYVEILKKHMGFEEATGTPLYIRSENG